MSKESVERANSSSFDLGSVRFRKATNEETAFLLEQALADEEWISIVLDWVAKILCISFPNALPSGIVRGSIRSGSARGSIRSGIKGSDDNCGEYDIDIFAKAGRKQSLALDDVGTGTNNDPLTWATNYGGDAEYDFTGLFEAFGFARKDSKDMEKEGSKELERPLLQNDHGTGVGHGAVSLGISGTQFSTGQSDTGSLGIAGSHGLGDEYNVGFQHRPEYSRGLSKGFSRSGELSSVMENDPPDHLLHFQPSQSYPNPLERSIDHLHAKGSANSKMNKSGLDKSSREKSGLDKSSLDRSKREQIKRERDELELKALQKGAAAVVQDFAKKFQVHHGAKPKKKKKDHKDGGMIADSRDIDSRGIGSHTVSGSHGVSSMDSGLIIGSLHSGMAMSSVGSGSGTTHNHTDQNTITTGKRIIDRRDTIAPRRGDDKVSSRVDDDNASPRGEDSKVSPRSQLLREILSPRINDQPEKLMKKNKQSSYSFALDDRNTSIDPIVSLVESPVENLDFETDAMRPKKNEERQPTKDERSEEGQKEQQRASIGSRGDKIVDDSFMTKSETLSRLPSLPLQILIDEDHRQGSLGSSLSTLLESQAGGVVASMRSSHKDAFGASSRKSIELSGSTSSLKIVSQRESMRKTRPSTFEEFVAEQIEVGQRRRLSYLAGELGESSSRERPSLLKRASSSRGSLTGPVEIRQLNSSRGFGSMRGLAKLGRSSGSVGGSVPLGGSMKESAPLGVSMRGSGFLRSSESLTGFARGHSEPHPLRSLDFAASGSFQVASPASDSSRIVSPASGSFQMTAPSGAFQMMFLSGALQVSSPLLEGSPCSPRSASSAVPSASVIGAEDHDTVGRALAVEKALAAGRADGEQPDGSLEKGEDLLKDEEEFEKDTFARRCIVVANIYWLFLKATLPTIFAGIMIFLPELINVHFASQSYTVHGWIRNVDDAEDAVHNLAGPIKDKIRTSVQSIVASAEHYNIDVTPNASSFLNQEFQDVEALLVGHYVEEKHPLVPSLAELMTFYYEDYRQNAEAYAESHRNHHSWFDHIERAAYRRNLPTGETSEREGIEPAEKLPMRRSDPMLLLQKRNEAAINSTDVSPDRNPVTEGPDAGGDATNVLDDPASILDESIGITSAMMTEDMSVIANFTMGNSTKLTKASIVKDLDRRIEKKIQRTEAKDSILQGENVTITAAQKDALIHHEAAKEKKRINFYLFARAVGRQLELDYILNEIRDVHTGAIGLSNVLLNTFGIALVVGLNQGIDVYVSTSHQSPGREHFALVNLGRAMLVDICIFPLILIVFLYFGPQFLLFIGQDPGVVQQATCFLQGSSFGVAFLLLGETGFRFLVFRGQVMKLINTLLVTCLLHVFWAILFTLILSYGTFGLGMANSLTWTTRSLMFLRILYVLEASFEIVEESVASSSEEGCFSGSDRPSFSETGNDPLHDPRNLTLSNQTASHRNLKEEGFARMTYIDNEEVVKSLDSAASASPRPPKLRDDRDTSSSEEAFTEGWAKLLPKDNRDTSSSCFSNVSDSGQKNGNDQNDKTEGKRRPEVEDKDGGTGSSIFPATDDKDHVKAQRHGEGPEPSEASAPAFSITRPSFSTDSVAWNKVALKDDQSKRNSFSQERRASGSGFPERRLSSDPITSSQKLSPHNLSPPSGASARHRRNSSGSPMTGSKVRDGKRPTSDGKDGKEGRRHSSDGEDGNEGGRHSFGGKHGKEGRRHSSDGREEVEKLGLATPIASREEIGMAFLKQKMGTTTKQSSGRKSSLEGRLDAIILRKTSRDIDTLRKTSLSRGEVGAGKEAPFADKGSACSNDRDAEKGYDQEKKTILKQSSPTYEGGTTVLRVSTDESLDCSQVDITKETLKAANLGVYSVPQSESSTLQKKERIPSEYVEDNEGNQFSNQGTQSLNEGSRFLNESKEPLSANSSFNLREQRKSVKWGASGSPVLREGSAKDQWGSPIGSRNPTFSDEARKRGRSTIRTSVRAPLALQYKELQRWSSAQEVLSSSNRKSGRSQTEGEVSDRDEGLGESQSSLGPFNCRSKRFGLEALTLGVQRAASGLDATLSGVDSLAGTLSRAPTLPRLSSSAKCAGPVFGESRHSGGTGSLASMAILAEEDEDDGDIPRANSFADTLQVRMSFDNQELEAIVEHDKEYLASKVVGGFSKPATVKTTEMAFDVPGDLSGTAGRDTGSGFGRQDGPTYQEADEEVTNQRRSFFRRMSTRVSEAVSENLAESADLIDISMVFLVLDLGNKDVYSWEAMRTYLQMALPAAFTNVCGTLRFDILNLIAGLLGKSILFRQVILVNFYNLITLIPQGIGCMTSLFIGQCLGRVQPEVARRFAGFSIFFSITICLFFLMLSELVKRITGDNPMVRFYNPPSDARPALNHIFLPMILFVFLPESLTVVGSSVCRACALWKGGLYIYLTQNFLVGLPCSIMLLYVYPHLDAVWFGVGVGASTGMVRFLRLIWSINMRERALRTLRRLHAEEVRAIQNQSTGSKRGSVMDKTHSQDS